MPRKRTTHPALKLSDQAREMLDTLAIDTGWTPNVTASRLIELGMYALTNVKAETEKTAHEIHVAVAAHAIMHDAHARVKALQNQKPR